MFLGNVIKKLRHLKGYKQEDLAQGVCSQKQLSRIENNNNIPNAYTLHLLSERLGAELYDYVPYMEDEYAYEIKNELNHCYALYNMLSHEPLLEILNHSKHFMTSKSKLANLEYSWLFGACSFYIDVGREIDAHYFLKLLDENLTLETFKTVFNDALTPIEYRIVNSIITKRLFKNDFVFAERHLKLAIANYEAYHDKITDEAYTRFLYNLSRLMYKNEQYDEAVTIATKGINHCQSINSMAYIADLYNIAGKANHRLGNIEIGKAQMRNYIALRRIFDCEIHRETISTTLIDDFDLWPMDCSYCKTLYAPSE